MPGICPSCDSPTSRPGRYCRACFFSATSFREKMCRWCGNKFLPNSGSDIICEKCKTTCALCGGKKKRSSRAKHCRACVSEIRVTRSVCKECGEKFVDTNGSSRFCPACRKIFIRTVCVDCAKPISPKLNRARCNSCARVHSHTVGVYKGKGRKRYAFNGTRYRSSWEVIFAKDLVERGIEFEYERYDVETNTHPDFYFQDKDFYVEIHPVFPELKKIPKNCVLVTTIKDSLFLSKLFGTRSWKRNKKISIDLVIYLRQAIAERDGE